MTTYVLGIKIDDVTQEEALLKIEEWIKFGGKHYVVTPNPEFIVAAQKDQNFKEIINKSDLSIPDGVGLKLTGKVKNRVTGADLMFALIEVASKKGYSIGLLGGKNNVAQKCAEVLKKKFPDLKISFAHEGGEISYDGKIEESVSVGFIPPTDILFVAFGHGKQEKWIAQNLPKIPVKVAMGVGGAFDYISGTVPRAPKLLRDLGLEWLFRLILQPWRIKRQMALLKYIYYISMKT